MLLPLNLLITSQTLNRIAFFCGLCSAWEFVAKFVVCYSVFTDSTWPEEISLFWRGVIYPLGKNGRSSSIRLTLLDSIYQTESSDLVDYLSGMDYTNCQEKIATAVLWIRTRHGSASERPCTLVRNTEKPGECFPILLTPLLNTLKQWYFIISRMRYLITQWQEQKCTKWLRFPEIYTTGHGKASPFQPWWSVRCAIPTFDVNQCSLRGSTFCFCLLQLGLAVTGAPAEHFGTRIHGVSCRYGFQTQAAYTRMGQTVGGIGSLLWLFVWNYSCSFKENRALCFPFQRVCGARFSLSQSLSVPRCPLSLSYLPQI